MGKPPQHVSVMRHCLSHTHLSSHIDLDLNFGIAAEKSPSHGKPTFLPVLRSGSCSEIGPKQYMEDEHICIDNLLEHLGEAVDFPSQGAFYAV